MEQSMRYDVVVVGSGGGGLRAAIAAAEGGVKTLVISRAANAKRSGATLLAGANISADVACDGGSLHRMGISDCNKEDSPEKWLADLYHEGFYLNNSAMAEMYVTTAPARVKELMDWGIGVLGMEGKREIAVYGSAILDTLYKRAVELGVAFRCNTALTDVVIQDGETRGVICLDIPSGEIMHIEAGAVVLATGGVHNVFSRNSGSTDLCGEGHGAALRAGSELIDMEMISYCPTVTIAPAMYAGNILPYILFSNTYGRLINRQGKTFTDKYLPRHVEKLALETEWNKMLLSYAIEREIQEDHGSVEGGVYYMLDSVPAQLMEELNRAFPALSAGLYADMMQLFKNGRALTVRPAAHYFEGGVRVSADMETAVRGLYAAGECTGGMFGANRVSAATTEMLVDGAVAGEKAAAYAAKASRYASDAPAAYEQALLSPFEKKQGGASAREVKRMLQAAMDAAMPVLRSEEGLSAGIDGVAAAKEAFENISLRCTERKYNLEWLEYLELRNLLPVAECMLRSALQRRESRGVHIRLDHLYTDNDSAKYNTVFRDNGTKAYTIPAQNQEAQKYVGRVPYMSFIEKVADMVDEEEETLQ